MKQLLEKALAYCDSAQIYQRNVSSTTINLRLGKVNDIQSEKKTEVSLSLVKDGNMGMAVSTSLEDDTLISRAKVSLENQQAKAEPFTVDAYPEVECFSEKVASLSTEDLVEMVSELYARFHKKAPDIALCIALSKTVKTVSLVNSLGFEGNYAYTNMSLMMYTLTAQGFYGAAKEFSLGHVLEVADHHIDDLIRFHRLGDNVVSLENERMPVIFSGSTMGSLMLRVLGGVNGGNVTKEISPLVNKLGEKVFSDKITIRDDATYPYGCNSFPFDDEGTAGQNTVIFEKGVLKSYLTNLSQAKALEMKPTGNAIKRTLFSKEIEDAPSVYDTNLIIEGESIPDDLLIKGIKRGLYVTGVMGAHTGNINAGDFSMNISSGFLIENGEYIGKVKGCMIAGNIYDLFQNIEAIGTEKHVMKSIFYHMGFSPMVLFKEVNIIGK